MAERYFGRLRSPLNHFCVLRSRLDPLPRSAFSLPPSLPPAVDITAPASVQDGEPAIFGCTLATNHEPRALPVWAGRVHVDHNNRENMVLD